jgi:F0F1-type ATP synthase membrane subunit b/b'
VAEQDQQLAAGVPRLIDQYKQRRQEWLAQADELVRLRDEVRTAAEREALEIVTAARRDVRRIVVEARRELLVLTAQLHAAIESVDQASLQAAETVSAADAGGSATDLVSGQRPLSAAEDKVLGARREVRTVLDEARAEIEALVAEANGPLREIPAALSGSSRLPDPPIPALDTILEANSLSVAGCRSLIWSSRRSIRRIARSVIATTTAPTAAAVHPRGPGSGRRNQPQQTPRASHSAEHPRPVSPSWHRSRAA